MRSFRVGALLVLAAGAADAQNATLVCNWGAGAFTPTVWPTSKQVMMTPVVAALAPTTLPGSQVAFISFETAQQVSGDRGGVLRVIDQSCKELARFPDPASPQPIPAGCPANLATVPRLAPISGLAVGNLDANALPEIVAVLDAPSTTHHAQIVAFDLVGLHLVPRWCSTALPAGDFIAAASAPALAELDKPGVGGVRHEVVIDNKVFNFNGSLRFSGGPSGPRSRTAVVAGANLPRIVAGRGLYASTSTISWTGALAWQNTTVSNNGLVYPAVAELDSTSPGPEIVLTDTVASKVRVLSANGTQLAAASLPNPITNPNYPNQWGGPPMVGDADGVPGPEIGVAGTAAYTLFKYAAGTLTPLWSADTYDPSGDTTSALVQTPIGARIYYADGYTLWIFNGATGAVLQAIPNTSGTAFEGPAIASLANGAPGRVVVAASDYMFSSPFQHGVRIFADPALGPLRAVWNQHTYHVSNVASAAGALPVPEPASWLTPFRNTYRAQQ